MIKTGRPRAFGRGMEQGNALFLFASISPAPLAMQSHREKMSSAEQVHNNASNNRPPYYDVKPETPICYLRRDSKSTEMFPLATILPIVGMESHYVRRAIGAKTNLSIDDVYRLLDLDAFHETFVPRSRIIDYLLSNNSRQHHTFPWKSLLDQIMLGDAKDLIETLPDSSIQCVVTSTPYWAMRIYDEMATTQWADGETCSFGLEQTPEGFIRHSVEIIYRLYPKITDKGSIWWDIMDTYNTRTQIRSNAAEALRAMQGKDCRTWKDFQYKRYSGGHSFLKDGEQCLIPYRIAERASRIGYYVKSVISWCKNSSLPEPQNSRVSRNVEYVLHLSKTRTPLFVKKRYLETPPDLGGKQEVESEKLSDSWHLPTSAGRDGHGAQFPLQLPGRCIVLTSNPDDLILDPFVGAGTTLLAAKKLGRHFLGFDVAKQYVELSRQRLTQ